jgi:hypothetical protein
MKFLCVWLLAACLSPAISASASASPWRAADEGTVVNLLSDSAIDSAVQPVMQGDEFLSLRRRGLEQITAPTDDGESGFLMTTLTWFGDQLRVGIGYVGSFFDWLFTSPFSTPTRPRPAGNSGVSQQLGEGWLTGWLQNTFGLSAETVRLVLSTLLIIVILAITLIFALLFRRIERKRRSKSQLNSSHDPLTADITAPPGELPAATYEGRARRYAADGNYRMAIRELLLGSMSWTERAGLIRYRKGLTNRDYIRCVWRRQMQRDAMLATATHFELICFGRRTPTEEMFLTCLAGFQGAFHEEDAKPAG